MYSQEQMSIAWGGVFLAFLAIGVIVAIVTALFFAWLRRSPQGASVFGLLAWVTAGLVVVGVLCLFFAIFQVRSVSTATRYEQVVLPPERSYEIVHDVTSRRAVTRSDAATRIELPPEKGEDETKPTPAQKKEPRARPDWVEAPATLKEKVYRTTVTVGPYTSRQECDERLVAALRKTAADYIANLHGSEAEVVVADLSDGYLRNSVLRELWEEPVDVSVGPMVQLHGLVEFNEAVRRQIDQLWRAAQVHERLFLTAEVVAAVLSLVAGTWFYLRRKVATAAPVGVAG